MVIYWQGLAIGLVISLALWVPILWFVWYWAGGFDW